MSLAGITWGEFAIFIGVCLVIYYTVIFFVKFSKEERAGFFRKSTPMEESEE